ncbi:periplasmic chaperone for outer membrane proteins SurA [Loktanella fryxellensis]|uniref:Parvulin-like PPIase n=1 Tax=Loktanella fryxellensis TaxID=245187 RepID=A0A1H8F6G7_9RHOB|nr:peptidylprolyl isomerase [Loktanella fryxellensis]SEN26678.1 periplasmic chaperone for outer membrane proteins SurA [Loktanella fryxellensis]
MRPTHLLKALLTAALLPLSMGAAQAQFSPVITVNDSAITGYELDQRARLLTLFNTPGDVQTIAREQLIEERLKQEELDRRGVSLAPEGLAIEIDAFATRANLTGEQFVQLLAQNGVAQGTLEAFIEIGVTWRDYIRQRYAGQAQVTDADLAQAGGQPVPGADALELLLTEIIIAAPPPQAAEANAIAAQIAQVTSQAAFEAAARQYSALPSRDVGGRLEWLPLSNFPAGLQGLLAGLAVNEVTAPIPIPNGVALFQLRGIREVPQAQAAPTAIDYATYAVGGDRAAAQGVANRIDTCDDLYGVARGQPAAVLARETVAPDQIPQDIALELAKLDANETSVGISRGNTTLLVMMCARTYGDAAADPEALRTQLQAQRLSGFADALLADLRAQATIRP